MESSSSFWAIAGDIGGTNSRLAVAHYTNSVPKIVVQHQYSNCEYDSFEQLFESFVRSYCAEITISHLCLALPAPITANDITLTNINWVIRRNSLATILPPAAEIIFINDFEAAALGTTALDQTEVTILNKITPSSDGVRVVVGAGTGLGQAYVHSVNNRHHIFATEGGHCDFAPTSEEQISLLRYLLTQHSHVSYERLLSGSGIEQIYQFLTRDTQLPPLAAKEVSQLAMQGDHFAFRSIRLFCEIYGAYAGNMALCFRPTAGIYLVGGVTLKLAQMILKSGEFLGHYIAKGRMEKVASDVPLILVSSDSVGLIGAIHWIIHRQNC